MREAVVAPMVKPSPGEKVEHDSKADLCSMRMRRGAGAVGTDMAVTVE